ncbi:N-acetyl-gamma-glutamyl-phosphate reductase [Sphingobacteriaceae bacterium]|nr:N-acetyl-gamma-glutamyl-phosphate reductase [Sphingobacteriaceae bacterium]
MKKVNVTVIGAAGYTGGELVRLLVNHPAVNSLCAVSQSQQGKRVSDVFTDLAGETDLLFSDKASKNSDLVFLCLQHGDSASYLKTNPDLLKSKIIDLSRDFRLISNNTVASGQFIYGLPELNKEKIKSANYIANPGCFATAIQLAILPFAHNNLLKGTIQVNAITGSTGAGIKLSDTTHFSWRQNNISVYQAFEHAHNFEIQESLKQLQQSFDGEFLFIPQRGNFARGILATTVLESDLSEAEIKNLFTEFYENHPFTFLVDKTVDMKMAVNTNKCFIDVKKNGRYVLVTSVIDNLLKGAAGQAVQNMNLMFGFEEQAGLKLKAINY